MAKQFKPSEINRTNSSGYRASQVIATLEHYGYIPSGGGNHISFRHREYSPEQIAATQAVRKWGQDWRVHVSDHGIAPEECVEKAAAMCLAVKELNHERRTSETLSPIPAWLHQAVPGNFRQDTEEDVLRLFHEPDDTPRRSYSIKNRGEYLEVVNLNFPEQFNFTFTLREGDKNPQGSFNGMFERLDADVRAHMEKREERYEGLMHSLVNNRGYTVREENAPGDVARCDVVHAADPEIAFSFIAHRPHETIANETFAMLEAAMQRSDQLWEEWETQVDSLKQKGWKIREVLPTPKDKRKLRLAIGTDDSDTRVATLVLESPPGYKVDDTIEAALYGELKIGNPAFLRACLNEIEEEATPSAKRLSVSEARPLLARKEIEK